MSDHDGSRDRSMRTALRTGCSSASNGMSKVFRSQRNEHARAYLTDAPVRLPAALARASSSSSRRKQRHTSTSKGAPWSRRPWRAQRRPASCEALHAPCELSQHRRRGSLLGEKRGAPPPTPHWAAEIRACVGRSSRGLQPQQMQLSLLGLHERMVAWCSWHQR